MLEGHELRILALALEMGVNPAEIHDSWDEYWVNRLLLLREARMLAQQMR